MTKPDALARAWWLHDSRVRLLIERPDGRVYEKASYDPSAVAQKGGEALLADLLLHLPEEDAAAALAAKHVKWRPR